MAAAQLTSFAPSAYPLDTLFAVCLAVWLLLGRAAAAWFALGVILLLLTAVVAIEGRLDPRYSGDRILTQVRVLGFPERRGDVVQFLAEPVNDARLPARTRLSWREPPATPKGGDAWEVVLRLRVPRGASNPGGFDSEAWMFREGIGATGYVVASDRNRLLAAGEGGFLLALRQSIGERIDRAIRAPAVAAVVKAISIGTRHELSDDQWERYARTGTSHLMAISGLHIGLAAVASFVLAKLVLIVFRIRHGNHRFALVAGLVSAGSYVLISGSGVPAVRAFLMLAAVVAALARMRVPCGFRVWALALAVVVTTAPETTGNAGFLLSFAAVLLLLWLGAQSTGDAGPSPAHRAARRILALIRMQWVLLLGLLPATLMLFDRYAPASPLINLLAVPAFSLVTVPSTLLGLLLGGPFESVGNVLLRVAAASIEWIETILAMTLWPSGDQPAELGRTGAAIAIAGIAWACLPTGWPGRWLSVPAVVALLGWQPDRVASGCVRIVVLDVGQGQAVVVETEHTNLLYDTGPAWPGGGSAAANVILPYLAYRGIKQLDTTVVSHADLDHAGGLADLEADMPIGRVLSGEPLASLASESCHRAMPWRRDGVDFRFLGTGAGEDRRGNDASCLLELAAGEHRALLTGDIERPVEELLVSRGGVRSSVVVTVPHHGSRTSSSTAFIAAVDAHYALVSAAWMNRWGFPKDDVVRRWEKHGSRVISTSAAGTITVELCASGVSRPRLERQGRRRIWHSD